MWSIRGRGTSPYHGPKEPPHAQPSWRRCCRAAKAASGFPSGDRPAGQGLFQARRESNRPDWGNRTQGGKIHGRGSRVFSSLRSPISISLIASMAYGFCGRRHCTVLRSAQPDGRVAGQGWHTGKTVFLESASSRQNCRYSKSNSSSFPHLVALLGDEASRTGMVVHG